MLDWLKEIMGESYTDDIDKQVRKQIGERFVARADYNTLNEQKKTAEEQLGDAQKAIKEFEGQDIEGARKAAQEWQEKYEQAKADAAEQLAKAQFDAALNSSITAAKGRNAKAIAALLDVDALRSSKNQEKDLQAALAELKESSGYLFEDDQVPPGYAGGTGGTDTNGGRDPQMDKIRAAMGLPADTK